MRRLALLAALLPAMALAGGFGGKFGSPRGVPAPAPALPEWLVGVGDSIMQGYGAPSPLVTAVGALGTGAVAFNAGNPGETSAQISMRWLASEATVCGVRRCGSVWLEGGVNDLRLTATLPAVIATNMAAAVDDALAKGYVVVWSDILPCRGDAQCTAGVTTNILAYNALMATACSARAANTRLRCIFAYAAFNNPADPGYLLPAYSRDGLHLSAEGSAALGAMAAAVLP